MSLPPSSLVQCSLHDVRVVAALPSAAPLPLILDSSASDLGSLWEGTGFLRYVTQGVLLSALSF